MNKVIMIGNLTREPELSTVKDGVSVCKFDIAINGKGEQEQTQYFKIVAWRGLADNCDKYLQKGSKVAVVGKLDVREYDNKDGAKKTAVEIVADEVEFLSSKGTSKDSDKKESDK